VLSLYNTTFLLYLHYVTTNKRISLNKILGQMMNRDLLKEAIADAKAVKETAIANAKAVLEEVFTKNLRAELASKLEEMDNDENIEVEEAMKAKEEKNMMKEFEVNEKKDKMDEEFDLNEILAELEEGEDQEEGVYEADEEMEAGEEGEMEAGEMGDEEIDLEDMTEDDLKSFIEDVIADMVAAGELEAGEEMEAEMGDMEAEEEMGDMEELEEMDEVSWNEKNNPSRGATMKELAPKKVGQTTSAYAINEDEETKTTLQEIDAATLQDIGQQLLQIIKNNPDAIPFEISLPIIVGGVASIFGAGFGIEKLVRVLKSGKLGAKGAELANDIEDTAQASGINTKRVSEIEDEMDKMEELKRELQEVNLLNAKLLYTNKIFNSKTLNESQKLRVLKAFDKATSVKEAKVIYETLNEGMASRTQKPSFMNEIKGRASKATGFISESKQPIVEVDPMVARWQKLAGINK
jgi:hypothetical protein